MIEIENEVFTKCKNALQNVYGEAIFLSGEIINSPPEFPAVMIEEKDNYNYLDSISSLHKENHVIVFVEIQIYSNKKAGKKTECKKIASIIDMVMQNLGFNRTMNQPVTNIANPAIARRIMRFRGLVSKEKYLI